MQTRDKIITLLSKGQRIVIANEARYGVKKQLRETGKMTSM
jgi:hypothetical protein